MVKPCVNFCWFCFKWGIALAVTAALVAGVLLYQRVDEEIRQRVEAKLAAHYHGLQVRVRYATLIPGEGIEIRGLTISEPNAAGPQTELASVDEFFLSCETTLEELIKGQPSIKKVRVRRPVWRATHRPDGSWSVSKLFPLPKFSATMPEITIENGTLEIFDPLKSPAGAFTVRDVNLKFVPQPAEPGVASPLTVRGYVTADYVQRAEIAGTIDAANGQCVFDGTIDGLELSPELRTALPAEVAAKMEPLGGLRAELKLGFHLDRDTRRGEPWKFHVDGQMTRGRFDDPRIPYSLGDMKARFQCDNAGFIVDELTARNGPTTFFLKCNRAGYADASPLYLEAQARRMLLDQQLVNVLPESLREQWNRYLPEGEINANVKLVFDGAVWRPEIEVECLNTTFTYYKFPYRMERGSGMIVLKNKKLTCNLLAYTSGQPVRFEGTIDNPGPQFTGSIEIEGDNIPFDEKLFVALPHKSEAFVRSLNARGAFNFYARVWRDDPERPDAHQHVIMSMNRCSLNYDKFAYPLGNIRGVVEMIDGQWQFRQLEGTNDTGRVTCHGHFAPGAETDHLMLRFTGQTVPLEEELRDALPLSMAQLWNSIKPRGALDLHIDVNYWSGPKKLSVNLDAEPSRDSNTSIEPASFPYRWEKMQGKLRYQDGHVDLEGIKAVHGATRVTTGGKCDFLPDGSWSLQLIDFTADRVRADNELIGALPDGLRKAVGELKPDRPVNLRGTMAFRKQGDSRAPLTSTWTITAMLHQLGLNCGVKLENVYGSVKMAGSYDGHAFQSRGELALDSLLYKDVQFTDVMGPFRIDNDRVQLGAWVAASKQEPSPRHVTARLFGGVLLGDCQVLLPAAARGPKDPGSSAAQYYLRASLAKADLAQVAKEQFSGRQKLRGELMADVELQGTSKGAHTLAGGGNVRLRNADIYELPLMVSLLKILSVRQPDSTAFTKSDIEFRVQGEHILFSKIDFLGDAVSLVGQGQMNLEKQVDLTFQAVVGPGDWQLPILRNVMREASGQIMEIHVEGPADNPNTRSQAFPGVSQALQQLQAEMQRNNQKPAAAKPRPAVDAKPSSPAR